MSAVSLHLPALPNYGPGQGGQDDSPAYTRNPLQDEHRVVARGNPYQAAVPDGSFSKASRTGSLTLQIYGQEDGIPAPVFGKGAVIRGKVLVTKRETVSSVDLKLDGNLRLLEVGGSGHTTDRILFQQLTLWSKDDSSICPSSLDFTIPLRDSYEKAGVKYSLPPTYEVHLSGVPGFRAEVAYSITVDVTKTKNSLFGNHTVVSTPFINFPRMQPSKALPLPMSPSEFFHVNNGGQSRDWEMLEHTMRSRAPNIGPIQTKLFIPAGRTYSAQNQIPFRLFITGSAISLATFLPCSPTAYAPGSRSHETRKGLTRISMDRQISVDVRSMQNTDDKRDIFKVLNAGEATFRRLGDGSDWAAWEGEIELDQNTIGKVGSFKAGGLWVKDRIVLSIIPPNPSNSPLLELRAVTAIRIVTEAHGSDADFHPEDWSDRDEKNGDGLGGHVDEKNGEPTAF